MNPKRIALLLAVLLVVLLVRRVWSPDHDTPPQPKSALAPRPSQPTAKALRRPVGAQRAVMDELAGQNRGATLELMRSRLVSAAARPNEALLMFNSAESLRAFLARAARHGLTVLGQSEELGTARVRYDSLEGLHDEILGNLGDYVEIGANFLVRAPRVPPPEERISQDEVAFGNRMLEYIGATGNRDDWGRGVTIAILDSGVSGDDTFGSGRLQSLDIGLGSAPGMGSNDGHGTAVASLAAGADSTAPGVAPAAGLLSIRVTGDDGMSDIFTLAQGILAAVDAGAKVINISMGGYQPGAALNQAIDYATARGAIVVASAGNDQAAQLTWPAANPAVISVGAVDALGQQVSFSNSGSQLQASAPGYGVQAAWLDGGRISMDGTSASAPIVAGAIAAVMSQTPGLTSSEAWTLLQSRASDSGVAGADPAFGAGILNVGSVMNRNDPSYTDTAIASHYHEPDTGSLVILVQNRGSQTVTGMRLLVTANTSSGNYGVVSLTPGAASVMRIPVDSSELQAPGGLRLVTQLVNPPGLTDAVPANNRRTSVISLPAAP